MANIIYLQFHTDIALDIIYLNITCVVKVFGILLKILLKVFCILLEMLFDMSILWSTQITSCLSTQ